MIEHFFTAPAACSGAPFHHYVVPPPPSAGVGKFMEEKGTAPQHPLPTPVQGWVASAYILSCAPLLVRWQGNWIRRESIDE